MKAKVQVKPQLSLPHPDVLAAARQLHESGLLQNMPLVQSVVAAAAKRIQILKNDRNIDGKIRVNAKAR